MSSATWQLIISAVGILITVGGVWSAFSYWKGKTDERLLTSDQKFQEITEHCSSHDKEVRDFKQDLTEVKADVKICEKRLDILETNP